MNTLLIPLAIALVALNLADCILTWVATQHYQARELNPLARWLFRVLTVPGAMAFKMVVACAMCALCVLGESWPTLLGLVAVYLFLIGWNLARIRIHRRRAQGYEA